MGVMEGLPGKRLKPVLGRVAASMSLLSTPVLMGRLATIRYRGAMSDVERQEQSRQSEAHQNGQDRAMLKELKGIREALERIATALEKPGKPRSQKEALQDVFNPPKR